MLKSVPYSLLIVLSIALGLAPFTPKPHLLEKIQMLLAGELRRPLDIFDLVFHSTPIMLLLVKFFSEKRL